MSKIAALLLFLCVSGMAKMITPQEVVLIKEGIIKKNDPLTIGFNSLDGIAYALFIIRLKDNDIRVAQFTWGVRPGEKPRLVGFFLGADSPGHVAKIPTTDLSYDYETLKGSVQHGKSLSPQTISVSKNQMRELTIRDEQAIQELLGRYHFNWVGPSVDEAP